MTRKKGNIVPKVQVPEIDFSKISNKKRNGIVFGKFSEEEKQKIKLRCFDDKLYKMDNLGYESMEEYEANGKTVIFNPESLEKAIHDILVSRLSEEGYIDSQELEAYIEKIISFNKNHIRPVRDCIEGVMYTEAGSRDKSFPYFQNSEQINECLEAFILPGKEVELSNERIKELSELSDWEKSRIKKFCYNSIIRNPIFKDARYYDYPTLERELEEVTFIRLLQFCGIEPDRIFDDNFNQDSMDSRISTIYSKNCDDIKKIYWFLNGDTRWTNQPLNEEQMDAFINGYTIPFEPERENGIDEH